jgi:hypothetical protein
MITKPLNIDTSQAWAPKETGKTGTHHAQTHCICCPGWLLGCSRSADQPKCRSADWRSPVDRLIGVARRSISWSACRCSTADADRCSLVDRLVGVARSICLSADRGWGAWGEDGVALLDRSAHIGAGRWIGWSADRRSPRDPADRIWVSVRNSWRVHEHVRGRKGWPCFTSLCMSTWSTSQVYLCCQVDCLIGWSV